MVLSSAYIEEFEVLKAIYMDDLVVVEELDSSTELKIVLHPSTAENEDKKFVCLSLHLIVNSTYPNSEPIISIHNSRGLSDAHLASIIENLKALALSRIGDSMMFELIEYTKESLTDNNRPSCICLICLEYFQEDDVFFRTSCYHYFHKGCIKSYVEYLCGEEKMICPVCRLNFDIDESVLQFEQSESNMMVDFIPDERYFQWRAECEELYKKQQMKGGIIDMEHEKNKFLISSVSSPTRQAEASIQQTDVARQQDQTRLYKDGKYYKGNYYSQTKVKNQERYSKHNNTNNRSKYKEKPRDKSELSKSSFSVDGMSSNFKTSRKTERFKLNEQTYSRTRGTDQNKNSKSKEPNNKLRVQERSLEIKYLQKI